MKNDNNIFISINTKKGKEKMHIDQYARWLCLVEAIDYIDKKCEDMDVDIENIDWVKPIAFQKYINERFHSMKHDLTYEYTNGLLE